MVPKDAKADGELTDRDLAERYLLIYGGPDINKFAAG